MGKPNFVSHCPVEYACYPVVPAAVDQCAGIPSPVHSVLLLMTSPPTTENSFEQECYFNPGSDLRHDGQRANTKNLSPASSADKIIL